VLALPDDDRRLVRLAAAFPYTAEDFPVGENLGARCAGFGPGGRCGDDPDQWLTDYVESEIAALRRLYRR
jgi:hypothetical protein